jgi:hypothetical protein
MKTEVWVFKLIDLDGGHPMVHGTINDVRQFAKNLWKQDSEFVQDILFYQFGGDLVEEDFYAKMDNDLLLIQFLGGGGYHLKELCKVPLDDFYDEEKPSQELIDEVLEQIKKDVAGGDVTAIEELLMHVPLSKLGGYLPE